MENIVVPGIGRVGDVQCKLDAWVKKQHPGVEVALVGLASALQGGFLGLAFGYVGNMAQSDPAAAGNPSLAMLSTGGPWKQAAGFGTLMGVNAALNLLIKKARSGKEDVYGAMGASFGSGLAYSLVNGSTTSGNLITTAITTGMAFALFNGLFYQIGKSFSPDPSKDAEYAQGRYILTMLGLAKWGDCLKKGQLTDSTIMLWNDSALQEARIPPGPRLLILNHLEQVRKGLKPSQAADTAYLKPALAPPFYPQQQQQLAVAGTQQRK